MGDQDQGECARLTSILRGSSTDHHCPMTHILHPSSARPALVQAVHLVHDPNVFGVSTMSTYYPADHPVANLAGHIISGPEDFAPCDPDRARCSYLGLTVSQTWRNVLNSDTKECNLSIASNASPSTPDPRHRSHHDASQWRGNRPSLAPRHAFQVTDHPVWPLRYLNLTSILTMRREPCNAISVIIPMQVTGHRTLRTLLTFLSGLPSMSKRRTGRWLWRRALHRLVQQR